MEKTIILTKEAMDLGESILIAAGSCLKNYTPRSKAEIIEACQKGINKAQDDVSSRLYFALEDLVQDIEHGINPVESRSLAIAKAVIDKVKGDWS